VSIVAVEPYDRSEFYLPTPVASGSSVRTGRFDRPYSAVDRD
jgi:hypothetical protein